VDCALSPVFEQVSMNQNDCPKMKNTFRGKYQKWVCYYTYQKQIIIVPYSLNSK
jgi:hypothetical protein